MEEHPCPPPARRLRVAQWVRIRWWNACAWYAVSLAEALARLGHASFVLAPEDSPAGREAAARGLLVRGIGDLGRFAPGDWWRSEQAARRFLTEERIEVLNVHSGSGYARLLRLGRRFGIPVVRTRGDIRRPRSGPLQQWMYGRATAHHLAAADFIRGSHYADLGVSADRVTVLRGGIDTERLDAIDLRVARAQVRGRLGLAEETLLTGMVGRLSPVKGHAHFLRAMSGAAGRRAEAHLVIVGPHAQMTGEDLRAQARSLGLADRTHVIGPVDDPLFWTAALDLAVIASVDSEAICRSAFEILGLGIPLVATEVHAIPEVVVPGTGLLVPPADPAALAEAIDTLLASADLRASLARRARSHIREHYSLERFGLGAETMFQRVTAEAACRIRG